MSKFNRNLLYINDIISYKMQWFFIVFNLFLIVKSANSLRHLSGDLFDDPNARAPDGQPYPKDEIDRLVSQNVVNYRGGRSMLFLDDPETIRKKLLEQYALSRERSTREGREIYVDQSSNFVLPPDIDATVKTHSSLGNKNSSTPSSTTNSASPSCSSSKTPQRLCQTKFNTTAPMYGVSLTSGKPVTIVQKFPDLLQQVIYEVCTSKVCDVIHGECIQTYIPYLFLVIPLGPVTLTGQDYVLVESGCVCRPKYAEDKALQSPLDAIGLSN